MVLTRYLLKIYSNRKLARKLMFLRHDYVINVTFAHGKKLFYRQTNISLIQVFGRADIKVVG